jgi:hypothetical protein
MQYSLVWNARTRTRAFPVLRRANSLNWFFVVVRTSMLCISSAGPVLVHFLQGRCCTTVFREGCSDNFLCGLPRLLVRHVLPPPICFSRPMILSKLIQLCGCSHFCLTLLCT